MAEPLYCRACGSEDLECDCVDPQDGPFCEVCGYDHTTLCVCGRVDEEPE